MVILKPLLIKINPFLSMQNWSFKKYKNPPKKILNIYKYNKLINVYLNDE